MRWLREEIVIVQKSFIFFVNFFFLHFFRSNLLDSLCCREERRGEGRCWPRVKTV